MKRFLGIGVAVVMALVGIVLLAAVMIASLADGDWPMTAVCATLCVVPIRGSWQIFSRVVDSHPS